MPLIEIYKQKPEPTGEGWKVFNHPIVKKGIGPLSTYHYPGGPHGAPTYYPNEWYTATRSEIADSRWPEVRYESGFHVLLSKPPNWAFPYATYRVKFRGARLAGKDNTFVRQIDCVVADEIMILGPREPHAGGAL